MKIEFYALICGLSIVGMWLNTINFMFSGSSERSKDSIEYRRHSIIFRGFLFMFLGGLLFLILTLLADFYLSGDIELYLKIIIAILCNLFLFGMMRLVSMQLEKCRHF